MVATPQPFSFIYELTYRSEHDSDEVDEAIEFLDALDDQNGTEIECIREGGGRDIVKFGDTKQDVAASRVHVITVNHAAKCVDVVFRGTSRFGDWGTNLNAFWRVSMLRTKASNLYSC